ncbi:fumarate reductase [Steroidobacter denitrificans]|uniref:Fumarate reductase n=1 Tax=Steroidobacter denitrificans TaxID=465721 RepID=A0A127F744_STEDE|nr:FAD-dependent oxidoreductase [Steroidobacter denitrificans]AMN46244.1 fumarate reductase [Steroidobacter denitrificans]
MSEPRGLGDKQAEETGRSDTSILPRRLSEITHWDIVTDVAIVGYGGAGACAAIEAKDAGAEVIIFETASGGGGSTALSCGEIYYGGNGGTPIQKATGFEDSSENMYNYLMASGGPNADERKIRAYVDGSLDHYHWIVDKGLRYKPSFVATREIIQLTDDCLIYSGNEKAWPYRDKALPCPRGHKGRIEGDNGGPLLWQALSGAVEQRGIKVQYDSRVLALIADEHNEVSGVAIRHDMKEYNVRATRGVVLCTGGFAMNQKMLKKFAPTLAKGNAPLGNPNDNGSGIRMGMALGASVINMTEGFISMAFYPPGRNSSGIFVNANGQRYVNEDSYHTRVAYYSMLQPDSRCYLILHASDDFKPPKFFNPPIAGTGFTLEELEAELKIPAGALAQTMEYYNRHAAKGEDPFFHKASEWLEPIEPPYVALDCSPSGGGYVTYFTLGGLETAPSGEVLNVRGEVIPGLYTAGRTASGVPCSTEHYASGLSVGDATFSGRMAGMAAAGRIPTEASKGCRIV